jgi:hypothetical protein
MWKKTNIPKVVNRARGITKTFLKGECKMSQQFITARDALICLLGSVASHKVRYSEIRDDVDGRLRELVGELTEKYCEQE